MIRNKKLLNEKGATKCKKKNGYAKIAVKKPLVV